MSSTMVPPVFAQQATLAGGKFQWRREGGWDAEPEEIEAADLLASKNSRGTQFTCYRFLANALNGVDRPGFARGFLC